MLENSPEPSSIPSTIIKQNRIPLIAFDEIKLGTERRYLVKGIIPREGITVVWGPPKSGKSFWVTDLALHVALGRDYRRHKVVGGAVIYCAFEGAFGFRARIEAFRQQFLTENAGSTPFYLEPVTIDLVKDHAALITTIRGKLGNTFPVLVCLDTLNRSLAGSESSDEDMSAYVRSADAIRDAFNCAVIVIHHCGIAGDRPRGHTSLTGAAEAQLAVKRDAANNVIVQVEHMKDGAEGEMVTSRLQPIEVGADDDGDPISSCVVIEVETNTTAVKGQGDQACSFSARRAQSLVRVCRRRWAGARSLKSYPKGRHMRHIGPVARLPAKTRRHQPGRQSTGAIPSNSCDAT